MSKLTHRDDHDRTKLVNRLNRLEGQIRGIKNMVNEDVYCDDILIQVAAVKSALDAFSSELFKHHLESCVVRDIKSGDPEIVNELLTTIKRLNK